MVIKPVNNSVLQKTTSGSTVVVSGGQVISSGQIVVPATNSTAQVKIIVNFPKSNNK